VVGVRRVIAALALLAPPPATVPARQRPRQGRRATPHAATPFPAAPPRP